VVACGGRGQFDGLIVALYGPLVLTQAIVGNTSVEVGLRVVRVQLDGCVIVLYGPLVLAKTTVISTTMGISLGVVRV
jgi:hypothetical protein